MGEKSAFGLSFSSDLISIVHLNQERVDKGTYTCNEEPTLGTCKVMMGHLSNCSLVPGDFSCSLFFPPSHIW